MKVTQRFLRRIISEELKKIISERDTGEEDKTQHIKGRASKTKPGFDYTSKKDMMEDDYKRDEDEDWIQKSVARSKKKGTLGRCTGSKFGSESCPKGSKEYDEAKTFKKLGQRRRGK